MKIGIYGGIDVGPVHDQSIEYIAVDKGLEHLVKQDIHPLCVIGDMDSLKHHDLLNHLDVMRVPSIKDDTDTALALEYAFEHGYDEIDLYGVTQKRIDHFLAVLCLLEKYQEKRITIYDQYNKLKVLLPGKHHIDKDGYTYFSLFAFDESIISISNSHYPLDHYHLKRNDPLCVSNQMNNDYAIVETSSHLLLCQSKEKI